jgi:PleD family two-component response regulator
MIETEVRLATYSKKIRDMIISGEVKTADPDWLKKLKEQYMITDEEARDLEHHLLMSFQKLPMKGRILIADDDPLILKSISALLTENGYHVVEADNVTDALARLQAQPIDLILSDIKFSADDFEGFTFFKNVQTLPRHAGTPFIFMSALTDDVIIRSGVQLGVDDYLTKPIDPDILTATIEGKIKRHRALKFQ